MTSLDNLKENIDKSYIVLSKVIQFYHDSLYLIEPGDYAHFMTVKRSDFLSRTRITFWIMSIIELSKLLEKDEHFSIPRLLNKMINDHKRSDWNSLISKEELRNMVASFDEVEFKEKSNQLKVLRDKYYAHLDKRSAFNPSEVKFYYSDLEYLIKFVSGILLDIYRIVLDTQIELRPMDENGVKAVIKNLSEYREMKTKIRMGTLINKTEQA